MNFITGRARGRVGGVVTGIFDVVNLVFVTDHGNDFHHGAIDTFDDAIAARIVGACREVLSAGYFVLGGCELSAELRPVVGQEDGWASP